MFCNQYTMRVGSPCPDAASTRGIYPTRGPHSQLSERVRLWGTALDNTFYGGSGTVLVPPR
jgi:hypothetical protein